MQETIYYLIKLNNILCNSKFGTEKTFSYNAKHLLKLFLKPDF